MIASAPVSFALFDTRLGTCGVAWDAHGLVAVALPERTHAQTAARLAARSKAQPGEPPPAVRAAIEAITTHLDGGVADLGAIALSLEGLPPFRRRVLEEARRIPRGTTVTYAQLAATCGSPGASRAVGQAMATNPLPIVVPCHRVVAAGGRPGGFSAPGGLGTKARLLELEGGALDPQPSLFEPKSR